MKKMVEVGYCDVCGKEINCKGTRFTIRLGSGNWNNDITQLTHEKDLCRECYETVVDLLKFEPEKKTRVIKKRESKTGENRGGSKLGSSKWPVEEMRKMYCDGCSNGEIAEKLGMPMGSVSWYMSKFKSEGLIRGENRMPDRKEESPVQFRTVVDANGFVVSVE